MNIDFQPPVAADEEWGDPAYFVAKLLSRKLLCSLLACALFVAGEILGADFSRAAQVLLLYVGVEGAADLKGR